MLRQDVRKVQRTSLPQAIFSCVNIYRFGFPGAAYVSSTLGSKGCFGKTLFAALTTPFFCGNFWGDIEHSINQISYEIYNTYYNQNMFVEAQGLLILDEVVHGVWASNTKECGVVGINLKKLCEILSARAEWITRPGLCSREIKYRNQRIAQKLRKLVTNLQCACPPGINIGNCFVKYDVREMSLVDYRHGHHDGLSSWTGLRVILKNFYSDTRPRFVHTTDCKPVTDFGYSYGKKLVDRSRVLNISSKKFDMGEFLKNFNDTETSIPRKLSQEVLGELAKMSDAFNTGSQSIKHLLKSKPLSPAKTIENVNDDSDSEISLSSCFDLSDSESPSLSREEISENEAEDFDMEAASLDMNID